MMKNIIFLLISFTLLNANWQDDISNFFTSSTNNKKEQKQDINLTDNEMQKALKDALYQGVKYATTTLGKDGGYYNNPLVKIPIPKNMQSSAQIINKLGGQKYIKEFELSMNKAAQKAAPKTVGIFFDAIKSMDIDDAKKILLGDDESATTYFRDKTNTKLNNLIKPIIKESMKQNNVYTYYKALNSYYKSNIDSITFGLGKYIPHDDEDLDSYITSKAVDGLMKMIAEEEKGIRNNPIMRKTTLLKKVFSIFQTKEER